MLQEALNKAVNYLHPNYWFFEKCPRREVTWVQGTMPTFYGMDQGIVYALFSRASHIFGELDIVEKQKDLNSRRAEWQLLNQTTFEEYLNTDQKTELCGRSVCKTHSLKGRVHQNGDIYEVAFADPIPKKINYASFSPEVKGEALRSFFITLVHGLLEWAFGPVQGVWYGIQKVLKLLSSGVVKGLVNGNILLELIAEFVVEGMSLVLGMFLPLFHMYAVKTGLKTGLKRLIDALRKDQLYLFYPEDAGLEAFKGVIKGVYKDIYTWVVSDCHLGYAFDRAIGSVLGPIVAAGMLNIFVTQALE